MDPVILSVTFFLGLFASRIGLPPLAGFLIAGFILNSLGFSASENIKVIGELGVTLLLFSIGLKLKIKQLLRPEIWAVGSIHMACTVLFFALCFQLLTFTGLRFFMNLSIQTSFLLGFALSFSSTVFAVKIMEEYRMSKALNGKTAIGILIIQDILAVLFITFTTGKAPTMWALLVIALLPAARWLFRVILTHTGHGELQVLFGMMLALAIGAGSFELVGLKSDLGALIMGILLATHPRAEELADSLLSIKDFMLLGFFLSIGMDGLPDIDTLIAGAFFVLFVPLKSLLFFLLFTRFKLSARTSFLTAINLTNYSEFGLIVGAIGVESGLLASKWLILLAVTLSLSFIIASPLNVHVEELFERWRDFLTRFETKASHTDEEFIPNSVQWQVIIVGMGRMGTQTYDALRQRLGDVVLGVDADQDKVKRHSKAGRQVIFADITDADFWRKLAKLESLKVGVLAVPSLDVKLYALRTAQQAGSLCRLIAITEYDDEIDPLLEGGANYAFNIFDEMGIGLATEIAYQLNPSEENVCLSSKQMGCESLPLKKQDSLD
ncbi:cation:proton antiporter family protein [Halodesulfovibrio spirochaetisodalis]|uniref:4'-phosphopantetheinyl transferase n=1 Tax=Halodesulfovibrio spirochaetisodalis TaxID=1560234 RepID=A0A1B7XAH5_9BACT|nr:cation:proton antiporter family protein [Halodesulfovibrio spirochaetisodalis]OBQ46389.1 4'-phosphopantetheinyl transferase [Halodesulfovibrio spirochaetisodalis]